MEKIQRKLAAILCADVKDYSRRMGLSEEATFRQLNACRAIIDELIATHGGRIANTAGDSVVAEFPSVADAVTCAVAIQEKIGEQMAGRGADEQLAYRIGINLGDVIAKGGDILGDGVNVAARLEGIAEVGGICISGSVYDCVKNKLPCQFKALGERQLKNIAEAVRVYQVLFGPQAAAAGEPVAGPPVPPDKPSIAVLPFDNMSNDPEQEYFSDGITEDIITDLSKVAGLFVVGRKSSFVYKQKTPVDLRTIGVELGVKYLVEGSIRKAGERVRVTAQLIEAGSGHHLWAERYDRALNDIFAVQDEIATSIVQALEVKLTRREAALISGHHTSNMVAYDMFLRGRESFIQFTRDAMAEAKRIFQQIIEMDPAYSDAYAYLVRIHIYEYISGWSAQRLEILDSCFRLAERALELNEQSSSAHLSLGWTLVWRRQAAEGVRELRKALELAPNSDDARIFLSYGLSAVGQGEEALRYANEALRQPPGYPVSHLYAAGCAQLVMERYEECRVTTQRCLTRNPNFLPAYLSLVAACMELGRVEEAREYVKELRRLSPDYVLGVSNVFMPRTKAHELINNHLRTLGFRDAA